MYTMTTSNSKQTQALATFITFFLLLLNKVNSLSEVSFTIDEFSPNQKDIIFEGDAFVSKGTLHVTKVDKNDEPIPWSVGRARYVAPVQIWDSTTGQIASFTTSFSFVVKAPNETATADGLAFFLGPLDSEIPSDWLPRFLGLFNSPKYNSSYQIVAAEFDTYFSYDQTAWDPSYRHIGIDVNEIKSIRTAKWDWRNGEVANVIIIYHAPTKTLTISLVQPFSQTSSIVTANVDLKKVLPEWVRVGFSAASGQYNYETHDVLSWSFDSYWESSDTYASIKNNMHVAFHTV